VATGDFSAPWLVSSHAYRMGFHFSVRNTRRNVFMMTQPITDKPILYRRTLGKCALESLNGFHSSAGESLWWHGVRVYSGNKLSQSSPRKSKDSVSFGRVIKLDGASSILTNLDYDE